MNKALLYLRVSTENQETGFSLEAQERLGLEYAKKNDLEIVKTWKGSESAWGKKKRTSFEEMITFSKKHSNIEHIIFDIADRMSRNERDKMLIYNLIHTFDKTVHFARTNKIYNKLSSSDDEFVLDLEILIAKRMSNDISRKTKMGMSEKAQQGIFPSNAPIGYKNNPLTKGIDIDTINSPFIKTLFEKIASGSYSLLMLESELYEQGLRNPKTNKKLTKATLHRVIHNPMYYGTFLWNKTKYKGTHTPLVSKQLWDEANRVLAEGARPHFTKRNFPFNNLIRCGCCGCSFGGGLYKNKKYLLYACSDAKKQHKRKFYNEADIVNLSYPIISNISLPKDMVNWLEKGLKERFGRKALEMKSKAASIKEEHDKTYAELSRWYKLKAETEMLPKIFTDRETELKSKLELLENNLKETNKEPKENLEETSKVLEMTRNIGKIYAKATNSQKVEILKLVGSKYIINGKNMTVEYRKPLNILAEGHKRYIDLGENADKSLKKSIWGPWRDLNYLERLSHYCSHYYLLSNGSQLLF